MLVHRKIRKIYALKKYVTKEERRKRITIESEVKGVKRVGL